jgi:hypothetical protein
LTSAGEPGAALGVFMLVLTAKRDDRIRIGEDIEILIIYTADSRVRIGIDAPEKYRIERKPKPKPAAGAAPQASAPAPERATPTAPPAEHPPAAEKPGG